MKRGVKIFLYFMGIFLILLLLAFFIFNNFSHRNFDDGQLCHKSETPYTDQEEYVEYEPYVEEVIVPESRSENIYSSTLQSGKLGGRVFAYFDVVPGSIIKGNVYSSKRSSFGIADEEYCDYLPNPDSPESGRNYLFQSNILSYNFNEDTKNWDSPSKLCIYVKDEDYSNPSLNEVTINVDNQWMENVVVYETQERKVIKYRTVTKYRTEVVC